MTKWTQSNRAGAILLPVVVVLSFVVICLGFARLATFNSQVRLRLDRQREIQQSLATRSALHWLQTIAKISDAPWAETNFQFETARGPIDISLVPAPPVFPVENNQNHYDMGSNVEARRDFEKFNYIHWHFAPFSGERTDSPGLYEKVQFHSTDSGYESWGVTFLSDSEEISTSNTDAGVSWMAVDLSFDLVPTALWTEDPYGRRYFAQFKNVCKSFSSTSDDGVTVSSDGDTIRFGISPLGSPLFESQTDAFHTKTSPGLWLRQVSAVDGLDFARANLDLFYRTSQGGADNLLMRQSPVEDWYSAGIQVSGSRASLVKQRYPGSRAKNIPATEVFTSDEPLPDAFLETFTNACVAAGGIRLTLEVSATRDRTLHRQTDRSQTFTDKNNEREEIKDTLDTSFLRLAITPAYEYYTVLSWDSQDGRKSETSTVIRFSEVKNRPRTFETVTYDTHGTYATRKRQVK